ncbi:MAG: metallophosphoesterase family protein [Gemmatimonadota bacterium]|nr:metallophosphoesterase family protein [Gemmatimonadota bacterium]
MPDRIVLTWIGDPATTQAVSWRTDSTGRAPALQLTRADASPNLAEIARTLPGETDSLRTENGVALHHSATLTGLESASLYAYRVTGGNGVWSEWFHFRTASANPEPFSFLYFGDAQNEIRSLWSRVVRTAHGSIPDARFMIHAGDLVDGREGNHDTEWGEWFGAGSWLNAMLSSIPATGNHEYVKDTTDEYSGLSPHWRRQFRLPTHGPAGFEQTVYYVDYQGVRVIVLNSLEAVEWDRAAVQARWLEGVLRDNPNRWTVVAYHHPMYSVREGRDNPQLREHWRPLFERYRVDLVLQGHDHAYGRGRNVAEGTTARDGASGTVYVVSVSGPKMYLIDTAATWMERRGESTQLYQVVRVEAGRLRFEARTATDELYDAFDIVKRPNAPNLFVDRRPATPERRGVARRTPVESPAPVH